MQLISTYNTVAGATSATFSNIPIAGYKHLVLMAGSIGASGATSRGNLTFTFNGSTSGYGGLAVLHVLINGTVYNEKYQIAMGNGSNIGLSYNKISNTQSFGGTYHIMNAGSSTSGKSVIANIGSRTGVSTEMYGVELHTGVWANTAPITSIEVSFGTPIRAGGVISLYGVK